MECEKHKGTLLRPVYGEPKVCRACGSSLTPLLYYACVVCDLKYDKHGKAYKEPVRT